MAKKRGRAASTKPPAAAKKPVKRAGRGSAEKEVPEVPESEVDGDGAEELDEASSSSRANAKDDAGEDEDEDEDEEEEEEDDEDDSEVEYEDEPLEPKILPSRSTRGRRFNQLVRLFNLQS